MALPKDKCWVYKKDTVPYCDEHCVYDWNQGKETCPKWKGNVKSKDYQEGNKMANNPMFITMPLVKNVPKGKENWTLTTCPNCGEECWHNEELYQEALRAFPNAKELCTVCSLKGGK